MKQIQSISAKDPKRLLGLCEWLLEKNQTKFPILIRESPWLGSISGALIRCIERVWLYRCFQQNKPDMLFLKKTMSIYLSLVGPSRVRPRYIIKSGEESR